MPTTIPDAEQCYNTARMLLNDVNEQLWTDNVLAPMMNQAHLELQAKLKSRASPVMKGFADLVVTAYTFELPDIPADLTSPINIWERPDGSTGDFQPMTETDVLPLIYPTSTNLVWWCWFQENILFSGAALNTEILLNYWRSIPIPVSGTDSIGIVSGEQYLGPRIAALAAGSLGEQQTSSVCAVLAEAQLQIVLSANRSRAPQNIGVSVHP